MEKWLGDARLSFHVISVRDGLYNKNDEIPQNVVVVDGRKSSLTIYKQLELLPENTEKQ